MTNAPTLTTSIPQDKMLLDQLSHSVQEGTLGQPIFSYGGGGPLDAWLMGYNDNRMPLSSWWSELRDRELRRYVRASILLSGISYGRVTQVQNLEWAIEATDKAAEPLIERYVQLLEDSQFEDGWRDFINNWVQDYHQQDNGAFVELQGPPFWYEEVPYKDQSGRLFYATKPLGTGDFTPFLTPEQARRESRQAIQGIAHIDAAACWRTGNPEFPVIYRNQYKGYYVILHRSRVVARSQFRQAGELSRGIGFCAASRSFQAVEMIQATSDYMYEKVTGQGPAIGIVRGLAIKSIRDAIQDNALQMDQKGFVKWRGAALLRGDDVPGVDPSITLIDIKGLPDGFDRETEFTLNLYMLANAWGTDLRDLGWAKGVSGSTRADAETQDAKTAGKGREDAIGALEDIINRRILPKGLQFRFKITDDLEERRKAEIQKLRFEARAIGIQSTQLTANEAREIAARDGDLPPEFMDTQTVVEGLGNQVPDSVSPVDTSADVVAPANPLAQEQAQDADTAKKNVNSYSRTLSRLLNLYRKGLLDKASFKRDMRAEIDKQFTLAWIAGAHAVGSDPTLGQAELDRLIEDEYQYVQQFADAVQELTLNGAKAITLEGIRNRISLWANQFLRIKNHALMYLGGDKRLMWRYGDLVKVHCDSCLALNGHVATAKDWAKANILPQDRQLSCGGWHCQCTLEVTSDPLTRGPIPRVGLKHAHG